jgi:2-polyprenyl-3-methyl-5-hydroxy-6-metoxy-1,4-benzoquinol methylase
MQIAKTETRNFERFLNSVKKSPLQRKKLDKYLETRDDLFFEQAEEFSTQYIGYLESERIDPEYAVQAYQKLCNDMMKCQIFFIKNGVYPLSSAAEANEQIYSNEEVMKLYMVGLALSQFLWASHYEIYMCLVENIKKYAPGINSYLEIGPGHGIFLNKAIEIIDPGAKITVVDISKTSMDITKSMINYFKPQSRNIAYHTTDMLDLDLEQKYDFITMGEVLEHVNTPEKLLIKLRDLLSGNGKTFVSTCVNCPAIDHVYHFKTVDQIRQMFADCGLRIVEERIAPVEDLPFEEIMAKKITINYCAILEKNNG